MDQNQYQAYYGILDENIEVDQGEFLSQQRLLSFSHHTKLDQNDKNFEWRPEPNPKG